MRHVIQIISLLTLVTITAGGAARANIDAGLVGHWGLNGDTLDALGQNHGSSIGNPQWTEGPEGFGQAIEFDGRGDWIDCGRGGERTGVFDITGQITVAAWINVQSFTRSWQAIVTKGDRTWRLQRDGNNNTIEFSCTGLRVEGSQWGSVLGTTSVNDGRWHHLTGVYDGERISLYVDGLLDNFAEASGAIDRNSQPVLIGANSEMPAREFKGAVDEVRIYARALSPGEIAVLAGCKGCMPEDLNQDGNINMYDFSRLAGAWLKQERKCESEVTVVAETSHQQVASVIVPVYMYYIERYFMDVPDKTETDTQIKEILDNSGPGEDLMMRALENYKALPEQTRYQKYDAPTVQLTSRIDEPLDLGFIRERIGEVAPGLTEGDEDGPNAPTSLVADNQSTFEPAKYKIALSWRDNSSDEDGFNIYRMFKSAGGPPRLLASVGPNVLTYLDPLTTPADKENQYCYAVTAFRYNPNAPVGQAPQKLESDPSNTECSHYAVGYPTTPPVDTDNDGIPDDFDDCPYIHQGQALWTQGCPDIDHDGVADGDDSCPMTWGEKQDGCPIKYNLRWMGMKVLNNTGEYAFPMYHFIPDKGLYDNEPYQDNGLDYGEEPYLFFAWTNGMTANGMVEHGSARWCCGEDIDIKKGLNDYEPDADSRGEEEPLRLQDLRDHGLTVFPGFAGSFAEIDKKMGLALTVSLIERDYTVTITPEDQASALGAAFKIGGSIAGAVSSCVGSGGLGCLLSVGGAIKTVIETIFGLSQSTPPVTVDDPDDLQGTEVWAITRKEAEWKTSANGAYAFYFIQMPATYNKFCSWVPCYAGQGSPTTMLVRPYFCLYREGTSDAEIKKACQSYKMVLPWPMAAP